MSAFFAFIKKEPILIIAATAAIISMFFVVPSAEYLDYIDFKVLVLLFCLMALVAGFARYNVFDVVGQKLLIKCSGTRTLCFILVCLPFFSSMLITNDVALIAFVPFAIYLLQLAGKPGLIIPTVVMQTVAANLGSMTTPVGNPQNLYLFNTYNVGISEFFSLLLPYAGISFGIIALIVLLKKNSPVQVSFEKNYTINHPKKCIILVALFALCLLCVFRLLDYRILLTVIVVMLLFIDKKLFARVDYYLLLTFVCFFIFSGNLGRIPEVRTTLTELVNLNPVITSAVTSQAISNVPAAILLSNYCDSASGLLVGTNIGGLGTIIASLASLISFKFYLKTDNARPGKYLAVFSVINFSMLAGLLLLSGILTT